MIEMKKLYELTEEWIRVHNVDLGGSKGSKGKNEKKYFYNKKIKIPDYTLTTLTNIIKSLPDAPEVADEAPDYAMEKDGNLEGMFG